MNFSNHFALNKTQAELDFVDVNPEKDLPLFLDPFVVSSQNNNWVNQCNAHITSFFETLLDYIRSHDDLNAIRLLERLGEPNETCLGFSQSDPSGRGIGGIQARDLLQHLKKSKAVQTGLISDIAELDLFVDNIGPDKISDMTTNILRGLLIKYTQEQCELHGIALTYKTPSGYIWDISKKRWIQDYVYLPIINGKKILLVPKIMVRWSTSLKSSDYYNNFVTNFIREDQLNLNGSLVEVLKNGTKRKKKKSIKERYPKSKDYLSVFSNEHPDVLEKYKQTVLADAIKSIGISDLNELVSQTKFDEPGFAKILQNKLDEIKPGKKDADLYHSFMVGVLQFIFDGDLIYPKKEREINDGRKRIDITYTNARQTGFFDRVFAAPNIQAKQIMVECKNYTEDPTNPEIDQLRGRFSIRRGMFGIMLYRQTSDTHLLLKRCKDVAIDGAGYIIALNDDDICTLLDFIANSQRGQIDEFMQERFNSLLS